MKPQLWVPAAAFLAVSIPLVLLLNALSLGGEYRVWIALAAGVGATAFAQSRLAKRQAEEHDKGMAHNRQQDRQQDRQP